MPRLNAANNFRTELAQNITDTDTTFDVVDASGAPATPFRMTIRTGDPANGEIIEVGSVATNTFSSVQRGLEGTTTQSWSSGDIIEQLGTAGMHSELADFAEDVIASKTDFDDSSFFTTAPDVATALNALSSAGVVDEGTTADGDYWRFESGLQICIKPVHSFSLPSSSYFLDTDVNMPVSFVDTNYYVNASIYSDNWNSTQDQESFISASVVDVNTINAFIVKRQSTNFVSSIGYIAIATIGRWK